MILDELGNRIVAAIAGEIEQVERNRAVLKPPSSLDAWEAYHRGLWHMYRFNAADNEQAHHFFAMAVRLDPTFARAYAGLSFTHFQNAFLFRRHERGPESDRAFETAEPQVVRDVSFAANDDNVVRLADVRLVPIHNGVAMYLTERHGQASESTARGEIRSSDPTAPMSR